MYSKSFDELHHAKNMNASSMCMRNTGMYVGAEKSNIVVLVHAHTLYDRGSISQIVPPNT